MQLVEDQWCGCLDMGAQGGAGGEAHQGGGLNAGSSVGGVLECGDRGPEAEGLGAGELQMQGLRFSGVGFRYGMLGGFWVYGVRLGKLFLV